MEEMVGEFMRIDNIEIYNFNEHKIQASLDYVLVGQFCYHQTRLFLNEYASYGIDITDEKKLIYLSNFSVSLKFRGNGIGSKMLRYFMDAVIQPKTIVVLDCLVERLPFYKRNGFKVASIKTVYDREYATMYYEKSEGLD